MACSKGLNQRLEEDKISHLPDLLICQILSLLPQEDAVKTSFLSTRWRSLWLWLPSLELDSRKFPDFNAFLRLGNRFLDSDKDTSIENLKLHIDGNDATYLRSWINALTKRKIQHLYVHRTRGIHFHEMPLSLYVCETLVSLKLFRMALVDPEFVSLPCLKILHFKDIVFSNEATFERLVSSCPVLEELEIDVIWTDGNVYRVESRSLKKLCLQRNSPVRFDSVPGVVIDAPLLCCLRIDDSISKSFIVNNTESNDSLDISLVFRWRNSDEAKKIFQSFHSWISRVRDMTICARTFKLIYRYSEFKPLPQFGYMSRLCITLDASYLECFPIFLRSFPNLKSLVLGWNKLQAEEMRRVSLSSVPECLLSSLEFVEFKDPILGFVVEMRLLRYFLKNSAILKKFTLRLGSCSKKDEILKILLEFQRNSTGCEVVILLLVKTKE